MPNRIALLGGTGSIGSSVLDLIDQHPERYQLHSVSAHVNVERMEQICNTFSPRRVVMVDAQSAEELSNRLEARSRPELTSGDAALCELASDPEVDIVVAGIVGSAGLSSAFAAAESGKKILLANKESLVIAGELFIDSVRNNGATLIPIDSEHNAIFQSLPSDYVCGQALPETVSRLLLTASGGPFRELSSEALRDVTPAAACKHPNWSMGQKISVDSATLMNKGLELIEACRLFCVEPSFVDVHIHPESIIHSMVEYCDGSFIAQLGSPDMRTPIAFGLSYPDRIPVELPRLNLFEVGKMSFYEPDHERFPCLSLAAKAYDMGGTACTVLNGANEELVDAFLKGNILFTDIPDMIAKALSAVAVEEVDSVDTIMRVDQEARKVARHLIAENG